MVNLAQDILFQLDVFHLLVLQNNVFSDALHRVQLVCGGVLYEENFAEGTLTDHLNNFEFIE